MDNTFDKMFYPEGDLLGGLDESGIVDIAGPLVAACVILPRIDVKKDSLKIFEIDDCKKVHPKWHKAHAEIIMATAIAIGIGEVSAAEYDCLRREDARSLAFYRAITSCRSVGSKKPVRPNFLIVDGNVSVPIAIRQALIKDADQKSLCTAAASIVAKMWRDEYMTKLHERFPGYDWIHNKGHPSETHLRGLDKHGILPGVHRIRKWPFTSHRDKPEDFIELQKRRRKWRQVTLETLVKEQSPDEWTLSPPLYKPLMESSAPASETAKRGRGGRT